MSVQNTTGQPQFIEEAPDWSRPVTVETVWSTEITTARDGSEQRTRRRLQPRYRMAYTIAALSVAEFAVRRAKAILEQGAAVVVPIWTDQFVLASAVTPDESDADLDEPLDVQKFKVGSYAYFVGDTTAFRLITAIADGVLTLADGDGSFDIGATVYPCIVGVAADGANFTAQKLDDSTEETVVEEL